MLHIKLHDRRVIDAGDPMGRDWVGYDRALSDELSFEQRRGRLVLGSRADHEECALFLYAGDHTGKIVAEAYGYQTVGNERAIVGAVLQADHPWRGVGWVGPRRTTTEPGDVRRGHECRRKDLRLRVRRGDSRRTAPSRPVTTRRQYTDASTSVGGVLGFIRWFDAAYPQARRPTTPTRELAETAIRSPPQAHESLHSVGRPMASRLCR
jgi:hypothetical protein